MAGGKDDCHCRGTLGGLLILAFVFTTFGIVVHLLVLSIRSSLAHASVHVHGASLARFELVGGDNGDSSSSTPLLRYDLALNMSLRNTHKGVGFLYYALAARALYGGEPFGYADLRPEPMFLQPERNTTALSPAFRGQAALPEGSAAVKKFRREEGEGRGFSVDVELQVVVRRTRGDSLNDENYWVARCPLRLPLRSADGAVPAATASDAAAMECGVDYRFFEI